MCLVEGNHHRSRVTSLLRRPVYTSGSAPVRTVKGHIPIPAFLGRRGMETRMPPSRVKSIPLPDAWPRRVRSAVLHAVAIARTSLVLARGSRQRVRRKTTAPRGDGAPPERSGAYLPVMPLRARRC